MDMAFFNAFGIPLTFWYPHWKVEPSRIRLQCPKGPRKPKCHPLALKCGLGLLICHTSNESTCSEMWTRTFNRSN